MKRALNADGQEIGLFDGNTIKDSYGKVVYWISENDVFAPMTYANVDLITFNKGQYAAIGSYGNYQCVVNGELLFKIVD